MAFFRLRLKDLWFGVNMRLLRDVENEEFGQINKKKRRKILRLYLF